MNIAVVDSTLHLLSFARMPGAKLTSIDIAINKAFTAAGHRVPTHTYKEAVWPGGAAYGINLSNAGRFMVIGGGKLKSICPLYSGPLLPFTLAPHQIPLFFHFYTIRL